MKNQYYYMVFVLYLIQLCQSFKLWQS